ncbi:hypothetical protein ABT039_22745 [Streptomyces lasiicapitis]|uniref:hypothetical protein n=1 Tax=Streptomyces lasiicapitis TaxID=1923961 RepID=UPI00332838A8
MSIEITLRCNTDDCTSTLTTTTTENPAALRRHGGTAGWTFSFTGEQITDLCGRCSTPHHDPADACIRCARRPLHDLLGHDRLGHRTANALLQQGIENAEQLKQLTDDDILDRRRIGEGGLYRIRHQLELHHG